MNEQTIAGWSGIFAMTAGASAGLAGLVFVALSLHLKGIRSHPPYRYRAGSSLASMMSIFVLSSMALFPKQAHEWLGLEALVVIAADAVIIILSFLWARKGVAQVPAGLAHLRPYLIRTILAVGVASFGMLGAILVWAGQEAGLYMLAVFSIVTMVWVVINTWALVIGVTDEEVSSSAK